MCARFYRHARAEFAYVDVASVRLNLAVLFRAAYRGLIYKPPTRALILTVVRVSLRKSLFFLSFYVFVLLFLIHIVRRHPCVAAQFRAICFIRIFFFAFMRTEIISFCLSNGT